MEKLKFNPISGEFCYVPECEDITPFDGIVKSGDEPPFNGGVYYHEGSRKFLLYQNGSGTEVWTGKDKYNFQYSTASGANTSPNSPNLQVLRYYAIPNRLFKYNNDIYVVNGKHVLKKISELQSDEISSLQNDVKDLQNIVSPEYRVVLTADQETYSYSENEITVTLYFAFYNKAGERVVPDNAYILDSQHAETLTDLSSGKVVISRNYPLGKTEIELTAQFGKTPGVMAKASVTIERRHPVKIGLVPSSLPDKMSLDSISRPNSFFDRELNNSVIGELILYHQPEDPCCIIVAIPDSEEGYNLKSITSNGIEIPMQHLGGKTIDGISYNFHVSVNSIKPSDSGFISFRKIKITI